MAKKKKQKVKKIEKNRKVLRVLAFLGIVVLLLAAIGTGFYFSIQKLFYENPHFTLRKVIVKSPGWWDGRKRQMINILDLKPGEDKLFMLDLKEKRKRVKQLANVASVKIFTIMPDTLRIEITERTPRAFLAGKNSKFLTDEKCIVIPRGSCVNINKNLPIILGFDKSLMKGAQVFDEIKPAVELIMNTVRYYPSMRIKAVSIRDKQLLQFYLVWRGDNKNPYRIFMPYGNSRELLKVLRSAIVKARLMGERRSQINLSFDGAVVFR